MIEVFLLLWVVILTLLYVCLIISQMEQKTFINILIEESKSSKRRISDVERLFEPITCTTLESDYNGVDCPKVKKPKLVRKDD